MQDLKDYLNDISPIRETTWQRVSQLFKPSSLKKGAYFACEGQPTRAFAFLRAGVLKAFYTDPQARQYNKHFFTPPAMIGVYSALLTGKASQFTQQALTDCQLWMADFPALQQLYDSCPDLERVARRFAERYFIEKETKELQMALLEADQRYLIFQGQYPGLEQLVAQYEIASYLGISPTQLSRIRKKRSQA